MSKEKLIRLMGRIIIVCLFLTLITPRLLSQSLTLSIPDTAAASNSLLKLPIRITNVTGLGILSMSITLTFNQNVLDALGANSRGTISQAWGNPLTTDSTGQIKLTMFGITALEGKGILTYIFFDVIGVKDDTTTIHFKYVTINEGGIVADTIAGKFIALEAEPDPDIRLSIPDSSGDAGSLMEIPIRVSDLTGFNIDSLRMTLTYNKYVLQALAVITTGTLTENWTDSIEAILPGKISLFLKGTSALSDSGILCLLQLQLNGRPGMSTPIHFQGVRLYNDTLKIASRDGRVAITGGTISEVIVSIPDISADSSSIVTVPVFISDVTNKNVSGISIHLAFCCNVIQYQGYNIVNTLMDGWLVFANPSSPGLLIFAGSSGAPLTGQGILVEFYFKVVGQPGMQSGLTFPVMVLNEGDPTAIAYGGIFTVNYVIPVELISFNACVVGKDVLLNWATASESNNYGFEIQRATNLNEWCKIGFVPGHGTTTIAQQYAFADANIYVGTYNYRLKQIDINGSFVYSQDIQVKVAPPIKFLLGQNFPNPFNPITAIPFDLPEKANINLRIYNLLGEEVKEIATGQFSAGHHEVSFNATDLSAGLYFYKLAAKDFVAVKKFLVLK